MWILLTVGDGPAWFQVSRIAIVAPPGEYGEGATIYTNSRFYVVKESVGVVMQRLHEAETV